ncbi:CDP-diacylglycerol--glycerol-3-phosphate 3-phosphatidyltransferase [Bacterioplanes sanyensis]|uniref:CDP-diacylglycerol--glycerol-3-phosphate 3-phosphatidyltransferase n=1 Tax=Bacterioplanes sanyensis TaxID=1249553 RepID=A0A222FL96_9GAMM|nr:CDP-diacylglycerol--glycerol-3-phosphate 3-phosphatidyltransferase [Bacterioplanes sanyensis]ASP39788.1 CDP-diacylglycerol--glycerol-3-phosphate 3-phosphatidyltransferase [Bacterioplanes sanyensis]
MNLPNLLTLSRIVMIPLLVVCYYWAGPSGKLWAAGLFCLAAITDWFDGYLARRWNQTTPLGAFLDPVADKLIVSVALILLVESHASLWLTIPATIIVGREIVISALREWMAELGKRANIAVSNIGKIKTAMQMSAITLLLIAELHTWLDWVGLTLLYGAAVLTIWSMMVYLKAAWPHLSTQTEG